MEKVIKVKKLVKIGKLVQKVGDAGIDLRASGRFFVEGGEVFKENYKLRPGEIVLIKTGIKVEMPKGCYGSIRGRSGLALKGLHVLAGVVDESYRGEIGVVMINLGKESYVIKRNERIAQMIISPYVSVKIEYVDELSDTDRGERGFGDSGRC